MSRIILNVTDERKVEPLMVLLQDLSYVNVEKNIEDNLKIWEGALPVLDNPIAVEDFRTFSREELHERQGIC